MYSLCFQDESGTLTGADPSASLQKRLWSEIFFFSSTQILEPGKRPLIISGCWPWLYIQAAFDGWTLMRPLMSLIISTRLGLVLYSSSVCVADCSIVVHFCCATLSSDAWSLVLCAAEKEPAVNELQLSRARLTSVFIIWLLIFSCINKWNEDIKVTVLKCTYSSNS